jgi:membrane dipeptidase
LTDDQVKALAEKGGVIGLMTFAVGPGAEFNRNEGWDINDHRFQKWLDHCDHIVKLVGTDYVGWGSDGYGTMIHTPTELWKITAGLMERGYSKQDIKKILGENYLRVFERVVG